MPRPARARRRVLPVVLVLALAVLMAAGYVGLAHARRLPSATAGAETGRAGSATVSSTLSPPAATPAPATPAGPVRVVGLGDSVTSGEHCACDDYVTGFAHLLAQADGVAVPAVDDGESGSTSADLAEDLAHDAGVRRDVSRADVVVITMGANDLAPALSRWRAGGCDRACTAPQVAAMSTDLDRVLTGVQGLAGTRTRVLVTTYWNVFTDGEVADHAERPGYLAWSDALTRAANTAICADAARHGTTCVDLYTPFKGADGQTDPTRLLAADGDHPDAAGTAVISAAVLDAYERG